VDKARSSSRLVEDLETTILELGEAVIPMVY